MPAGKVYLRTEVRPVCKIKPVRSKPTGFGLYSSINSSDVSLPVPDGFGKSSVIWGAIRPISLVGRLGRVLPESSPAMLTIAAGGSVEGNRRLKPLAT